MNKMTSCSLEKIRLLLIILFMSGLFGCGNISAEEDPTELHVDQRYWVTATPAGNGMFGYFIGVSDTQTGAVTYSLASGTNVLLLAISDNRCKIEGPESVHNEIIQGWIQCNRLVKFEPTPVPENLYIHSP